MTAVLNFKASGVGRSDETMDNEHS